MEILLAGLFFVFAIAVAVAIVAGVSAFFGWIFMLLWNFAVVGAFGLPELDFWHSWALWFLIAMVARLFRSSLSTSDKKD